MTPASAGSTAHTWGSTRPERSAAYPCVDHLPDADEALFRALDVDAPAATLFRWLCQLKVAPYSYDWLDNCGRRSPRRLLPGLDDLAVGQRAMTWFTLAAFERDRHLTFVTQAPGPGALLGRVAVTYRIIPRDAAGVRLVVKLLVRYPRGPLGAVLRRLLPWGDLVMMRRQLLNLKALAETSARG